MVTARVAGAVGSGDNQQVQDVLAVLREVLGENIIGVYIHGSAVLSSLKPHSDIDILVATRRGLCSSERSSLATAMLRVSSCRVERTSCLRPLELTVFAESAVRPWKHPPRLEFLYGEWLRDAFESLTPPKYPVRRADLTTVLAMALQSSYPLFGLPIQEAIDGIPESDVFSSMTDGIPDLLRDFEGDTVNVLLTFTRMWYTLANKEFTSKDNAARWVLGKLPDLHHAAIDDAMDVYLGMRETPPGNYVRSARACVDYMLKQIEGMIAGVRKTRRSHVARPRDWIRR